MAGCGKEEKTKAPVVKSGWTGWGDQWKLFLGVCMSSLKYPINIGITQGLSSKWMLGVL